MPFVINHETKVIRGTVVNVSADNPAHVQWEALSSCILPRENVDPVWPKTMICNVKLAPLLLIS